MRKLSYLLGGLIISLALAGGARGQWPTTPGPGLPVCTAPGFQTDDGYTFPNGYYIAFWGDEILNQEYYQVMDEQGNFLLPVNGIPLTGNIGRGYFRMVPSDNGDLIVIFRDERMEPDLGDVFAQRFDWYGNKMWGDQGVPVSVLDGENLIASEAVADSAGGAFIVIEDDNYANNKIWAQHLSADGERLWGEIGVLIRDTVGQAGGGEAVPDLQGGVIVSWYDGRSSPFIPHLYLQHIDSAGNSLWPWNGRRFLTQSGAQWAVIMCEAISDGAGGGIWFMPSTSAINTNYAVFQRLDYDGRTVWQVQAGPYCLRFCYNMVFNRYDHHYWALTREVRFVTPELGNPYIYRLDAEGNLDFPNGLLVGNRHYSQYNMDLTACEEGVIVCFEDRRYFYTHDIDLVYGQKVDTSGNYLWSLPDGILMQQIYLNTSIQVCPDGFNGAIMISTACIPYEANIYAHKILYDGSLGALPELDPTITISGTDIQLTWTSIPPANGYNIYISADPYSFPAQPDTSVSDTVFTDTGAVNEGLKYYRITYWN